MENLHRINIKLFLRDPQSLDSDTAFAIFSDWIPTTTDELLIDVADYSHVPNGPATLLVGHDASYCLDDAGGRRGLLYARKQPLDGDLETRLLSSLQAALTACKRIEDTPSLESKVSFNGSELLLEPAPLVPGPIIHLPRTQHLRDRFEMFVVERGPGGKGLGTYGGPSFDGQSAVGVQCSLLRGNGMVFG